MFPQRSTYRPMDGTAGLGAYYANTFEQPISGLGANDPGQQAGGAWCGTRGARPPHCQGCIAHPIYTSRLGDVLVPTGPTNTNLVLAVVGVGALLISYKLGMWD